MNDSKCRFINCSSRAWFESSRFRERNKKKQAESVDLEKSKIFAVLNKASNKEEKVKQLLDKLGLPLIATIPYDEKIAIAEKEGRTLENWSSLTNSKLIKFANYLTSKGR